MMKVMVMVKASKGSEAGEMPSTELLAEMGRYNQQLAQAGVLLSGEGLHPSSKGARVRFSGKNRTVIDGPFTETKELVAGFWIWRVDSLAEAVEWVKKCPTPMNEDSDIEIRPVFAAEDFGEAFTPQLREQEAAVMAKGMGLNMPAFQDSPERLIAGLNQRYTSETRVGIPQQWERFMARAATIPDQAGSTFYGVCCNGTPDGSFDYLTGVEVSAAAQLPPEFSSLKLDPRRFAVFAHTGHVSAIPRMMDTIWNEWVPDCAVKIDRTSPCFERYTPEFNPRTGLGGMEIWIPLEA
jgi:AraC family transcriptional regulator